MYELQKLEKHDILDEHFANYLKSHQFHIVGDNKYPEKYSNRIK